MDAQTITLGFSSIPASATRIVAITDGPGIANVVYAAQDFAAGTASLNMNIGVQAGGPYRVRAIAFRAGGVFPAILRSGKVTGVSVAAGGIVNASIMLADIQAARDASTPTSGVAGESVVIKININDTGDMFSGTSLGRIWSSATPFTQNLRANQNYGTMASQGGGAYQPSVAVPLPASGGTLFYQLGEAPNFSNPNGQEALLHVAKFGRRRAAPADHRDVR